MNGVPTPNAAELLNLVGFATGAALYALLLVLVLRDGGGAGDAAGRVDRLPLATALLGLVWSVGEVFGYLLPRTGLVGAGIAASALSFAALGLLAAVVVHSVARELTHARLVTGVAYACSTAAGVLHLHTAVTGDHAASGAAFLLVTIGFGAILVPLAVLTRGQPNGRRALWILALVLFAVSASHLGRFHGQDSHWLAELLGHQAAIPLAFAILYQDYRFALADLFLKRALTLLALVVIAFGGYSAVVSLPPGGPLAVGALLTLWVATAMAYPWLRRSLARFVDTVLLNRSDYGALRAELAQIVLTQDTVEGVLDAITERLGPALNARRVSWTEPPARAAAVSPSAACAHVDTVERPTYLLHVSDLVAGRRLLSDDLALVESAAVIAARRIDHLRLTHERYARRLREEEMRKLTAEAELRALRAQINPHFLFNALTTIGYLIETTPPRALETLMRLTSLLRGVLRSDGEFTTLGREIELVEHYLDIERARFEERLRARLDVPEDLRGLRVPSLLLQPLVENAVKHGIAPCRDGGDLEITARITDAGDGGRLCLRVRNTGTDAPRPATDGAGVGLMNVERRLAGHFGVRASLTLTTPEPGTFIAEIRLPAIGTLDHQPVAAR